MMYPAMTKNRTRPMPTLAPRLAHTRRRASLTKPRSLRGAYSSPGNPSSASDVVVISNPYFFATLPVANARVNQCVGEIHKEIDPEKQGGNEEGHALNDRIVPRQDGQVQPSSYSRPGENGLGENGSREQEAHLQSQDGDHRQESVLQRMSEDHHTLRQPLCSGRADIVLLKHLQHCGAGHAGDNGHGYGAQSYGRQDEMLDAVEQRFGVPGQYAVHDDQVGDPLEFDTRIQPRHRGQPTEAHREETVEHQPQPENGQGNPQQAANHGRIIEERG